jgi:hypothetical protein
LRDDSNSNGNSNGWRYEDRRYEGRGNGKFKSNRDCARLKAAATGAALKFCDGAAMVARFARRTAALQNGLGAGTFIFHGLR